MRVLCLHSARIIKPLVDSGGAAQCGESLAFLGPGKTQENQTYILETRDVCVWRQIAKQWLPHM